MLHISRLPYHPRLGRHVGHDDRSRLYPYRAPVDVVLKSVQWTRRVPIFDQGQLGSCTGNAMLGALVHDPVFDTLPIGYGGLTLNESGAVKLYSSATLLDGYPGNYPPADTGSDGLSVAKAAQRFGLINGYTHAFDIKTALAALMSGPFITGITWKNDMFNPDDDGRVHFTGSVAGGHEFVATGYDADNSRVWFDNSWGVGWGAQGRFYMTVADYTTALADSGDVTILVPITAPIPTPGPVPTPPNPSPNAPTPADHVLWAVAGPWSRTHHTGIAGNNRMAEAVKIWATAKGLS